MQHLELIASKRSNENSHIDNTFSKINCSDEQAKIFITNIEKVIKRIFPNVKPNKDNTINPIELTLKTYIPLESICCYYSRDSQMLYPMQRRLHEGTWCPDLTCGVNIHDCEDELFNDISAKDIKSMFEREE